MAISLSVSEWSADNSLRSAAALTAINEIAAEKARSLSVSVNWILNPNARIGANLIQTKYNRLGSFINKEKENKALIRFTLQFF